jgi:hypothetical protein
MTPTCISTVTRARIRPNTRDASDASCGSFQGRKRPTALFHARDNFSGGLELSHLARRGHLAPDSLAAAIPADELE